MKFSLYKCHKCGSDNIQGGPYEGDFDAVWQVVDCEDCGASRTETYVISEVVTIDENDKQTVLYDALKDGQIG